MLKFLVCVELMILSLTFAGAQAQTDEDSLPEVEVEVETPFLPNTSSPDVTLIPIDATTAWGFYKQYNDFHVFRCNADTGICSTMTWPISIPGDEQEDDVAAE